MDLDRVYYRMKGLTVYRALLQDPAIAAALELVDALRDEKGKKALNCWGELCALLLTESSCDLSAAVHMAVYKSDAPWPRRVAAGERLDDDQASAARRDLEALSLLSDLDSEALRPILSGLLPEAAQEAVEALPGWTFGPLTFEEVVFWYQTCGVGPFTGRRAFLWDGGQLLPVRDPDVPRQEDLVGYKLQRDQVEKNTRALLAGKRVNNVLLFGESGTGKSATVKSLLSLPDTEQLRLIEIEKNSVTALPQLIRTLAGERQKFILFIDDLAFDQDDSAYSVLKTILEGGLEPRPDNVAIYATSNRRNLVRQTFSDRAGDEVDRDETIQEKTALADRFGLRVVYQGFTKAEYLALVKKLARDKGVKLKGKALEEQAVKWDVRHPGRSPRTARQFVDSL